MGRVGPKKKVILIKKYSKKYSKKLFKKISVIFHKFSLHFNQYRFVFLYCKDTSIKIPGFRQDINNNNNKKIFCFHAYGQVSQKYI